MKVIPIALLLSLIGCIVAETEIFSIQWEPNKIRGTNQWEPVFPNDRPLPEDSEFSKPAKQMESIFVDEIGPNKTIMQKEDDSNLSGINVTFLDLKPDQYRKVLELLPGAQLNLVTLQWTKTKTQNPYLDVLERTTVALKSGSVPMTGLNRLQKAGADLRRAGQKKTDEEESKAAAALNVPEKREPLSLPTGVEEANNSDVGERAAAPGEAAAREEEKPSRQGSAAPPAAPPAAPLTAPAISRPDAYGEELATAPHTV